MTKKKTALFFILLLPVMGLSAQHMEELYSPTFLTGGVSTVSDESPMADIFNPAVSGADQRISLDLNYLGLHGFDPANPGYGIGVNLGGTFPGNFGVLTGSLHFLSSPFTGTTNLGTLGELDFSFAKDLYPNFLIGAGLQLILGSQPNLAAGTNPPDWGLAASLGFVHILNDLWIFKDFSWGFAMRGLGKGFDPNDDANTYWGYARPFTPAVAANFKLLKHKIITISLLPDLAFPAFQNIQFNLGADLKFFDMISLRGGMRIDMRDMLNENTSRIPFTFGLAGHFKLALKQDIKFLDISERGWNQSDLKVNLAALPLHNGVWGIGGGLNASLGVLDKTPPEIKIETAAEIYISPNLDGISDNLILPINITDKRFVKGYKLVITDESANVIREIENKDERPENVTFKNVLSRLTYVKKGITIPESIRWDGKSETGTVVEDGKYAYSLESWDDNGNIAKSEPKIVHIDSTAPVASVALDYMIFSPNNDGNKDVLPIKQEGSVEDTWQGIIRNTSGEEIRHLKWESSAPVSFDWDGKDDAGILAPDGVYAYLVQATDRAGNDYTLQVDNIIINTAATPININIGLGNFSPNGDGIKDIQRFNLEIPVTNGIEVWNLDLVTRQGSVVKSFSGTSDIPLYIDFDGKGDSGNTLAEGFYTGKLKLLYNNGNNPEAVSPEFEVDLTKPSAFIKANLTVFSPNNDGNKDTIIITQDSSDEVLWNGAIVNSSNAAVKSYTWKGLADSRIEWDGTDDKGRLMEDGSYSYSIRSTDKAGNQGGSAVLTFQLNTEETPVILSMSNRYFSPNRDGVTDELKLIPHVKITTGIESYTLQIISVAGTVVKTFTGKNSIPDEFSWDGTDADKKAAGDGEYMAELTLLYKNGNEPSARTNTFFIDTQFPEIKVTGSTGLFSPDGDGRLDTVKFLQISSSEDLWDGEIIDSSDAVVKTYYWKGTAGDFEWNGRDENGNLLANGFYKYRVFSTDKAGNKTVREISNIEIDNTPTSIFLTVQSAGLSPNKDGYMDTISLKPYVSVNDRIKEWKLSLIHRQAGLQKVFRGEGKVAAEVIWNGDADDGGLASEGVYTAELSVEYLKGNMPIERTTEFRLDLSPPEINLAIDPELFSPDNDGLNDELSLRPVVTDLSPILQWKIEVRDPVGNFFTSFSGKGKPTAEIIWDGVSSTGELVQSAEDYKLEFTVTDDLGNTAKMNRVIPIDILVIRDGNRLKIRIASITFAPNTADYIKVDEDKKARNMKTIERLAEIFKKYDTYNILIEGHAVSVYWPDEAKYVKEQAEELVPLSKERAESIKRALIEFGLEANRISTDGIGGAVPVVPHNDRDNRWKNRRVEFILIRK